MGKAFTSSLMTVDEEFFATHRAGQYWVNIMKIKALSKLKPEEGIWMTEVEKPEV